MYLSTTTNNERYDPVSVSDNNAAPHSCVKFSLYFICQRSLSLYPLRAFSLSERLDFSQPKWRSISVTIIPLMVPSFLIIAFTPILRLLLPTPFQNEHKHHVRCWQFGKRRLHRARLCVTYFHKCTMPSLPSLAGYRKPKDFHRIFHRIAGGVFCCRKNTLASKLSRSNRIGCSYRHHIPAYILCHSCRLAMTEIKYAHDFYFPFPK